MSRRARKQHVANCDDSVCNADETAFCHSDPWFASNGSRRRLCIASAAANQLSGGQKIACESNKLNVQLRILLHNYSACTSVWSTVDEILHLLQSVCASIYRFIHPSVFYNLTLVIGIIEVLTLHLFFPIASINYRLVFYQSFTAKI